MHRSALLQVVSQAHQRTVLLNSAGSTQNSSTRLVHELIKIHPLLLLENWKGLPFNLL